MIQENTRHNLIDHDEYKGELWCVTMAALSELFKDACIGLGLLCFMCWPVLLLILFSERHRHPELISCSQCKYRGSEANVLKHETEDHPAL